MFVAVFILSLQPELYFKSKMDTYKNLILQYSTKKESFSLDDLWGWLSAMGLTTRSTMNCMLSRMVDKGELVRIARGVYASAGHKNLFTIELTAEEQDLARNLKERFPFAPLCIYNGSCIAPLQHHLSGNSMTYVETDRQVMESLFEHIKEHTGKEVWLMPDADMVYRYIDLGKGGIIVKPLVTEAPLQTTEGVPVPTLEKLLVDINKDADFSYLHGAEAERMTDNAKALYIINITRLRRYAKRRGLKIEEKL